MIPIRNATPYRRRPWVTWCFILINAGVFFYELSLSPGALKEFFNVFGLVPAHLFSATVRSFQGISNLLIVPLLSSVFIHGDFFHIFFNLWTLYLFGPNIEDRLGHSQFASLFLLSGIASGIIHSFVHPQSTIPTVGASGAIAGVLGAYFVLLPLSRITVLFPVFIIPFFFDVPAFLYLFIWFFSQLHQGAWSLINAAPEYGGVAFWAHIGGFLTGIYLLSLLHPPAHKSD
ncbi:MAG TPA: rhomboid family intramembrane serine protease [bacterium]|nr:rhomboid family intramembrane serine protease [bacterium]